MANDLDEQALEQILEMLGEGIALKLLDILTGSVYVLWCFDCNRWSKLITINNLECPLLGPTLAICLNTDADCGIKRKYLLLPEHMEPRT